MTKNWHSCYHILAAVYLDSLYQEVFMSLLGY